MREVMVGKLSVKGGEGRRRWAVLVNTVCSVEVE